MLNRRQFITTAGLSALSGSSSADGGGRPRAGLQIDDGNILQGGHLFDLARAYKVMDEEGLDALIVTRPIFNGILQ